MNLYVYMCVSVSKNMYESMFVYMFVNICVSRHT